MPAGEVGRDYAINEKKIQIMADAIAGGMADYKARELASVSSGLHYRLMAVADGDKEPLSDEDLRNAKEFARCIRDAQKIRRIVRKEIKEEAAFQAVKSEACEVKTVLEYKLRPTDEEGNELDSPHEDSEYNGLFLVGVRREIKENKGTAGKIATDLLEREYPQEWGKMQRHEVTTKDGDAALTDDEVAWIAKNCPKGDARAMAAGDEDATKRCRAAYRARGVKGEG